MKVFAIAIPCVIGCSTNADIGVSQDPVTCKATAVGAANGSVSNIETHASYAFGATQASLSSPNSLMTVALDDSSLALRLMFPCGQPQLGTFDVTEPRQQTTGGAGCPFSYGSVSGNLQQVYASSESGVLIIDQNVGCIAGRYDIDFGQKMTDGTLVDQGRVAGWFSVPLQ